MSKRPSYQDKSLYIQNAVVFNALDLGSTTDFMHKKYQPVKEEREQSRGKSGNKSRRNEMRL